MSARLRARYAQLIDHFHLTPAEIGRLTDRQINQLYFHPRDEHGGIAMPSSGAPDPSEPTRNPYRDDMCALDGLLASHMISQADHTRLIAELKVKYGRDIGAGGTGEQPQ